MLLLMEKMEKRVKVLVLLIGVFVLSAGKGYACSCIKPEAPEALRQAQAVFVGQVIDVTDPRSILPEDPASERMFTVKFRVERAWKGAPFSGEVNVLSAQGNGSCAHPPVSLGERYLIYAESAGGWPMISSCSRTALLTDPVTAVESLGEAATARNSRRWSRDFLALEYGPYYSSLPARHEWLDGQDAKADADLRLLESLLFPGFDALPSVKKEPGRRPQSTTFEETFRRRFGY
jgi:hypothetical protein